MYDLFIQLDILCIHLEGGTTAIGVLFEVEAYIDASSVLQMFGFISFAKGDTIHSYYAIGEIKMQMASVTHGACTAVIDQMTTEEERSFISRSEGFEALENLIHLPVHIAQFNLRFDIQG